MTWVFDEASLRDFISFVMFHAPDQFPAEDYLKPDVQLNLDRAFGELRRGLQHVGALKGQPERSSAATALVERAYLAFRDADQREGARLLMELETCLGFRSDEGHGYGQKV